MKRFGHTAQPLIQIVSDIVYPQNIIEGCETKIAVVHVKVIERKYEEAIGETVFEKDSTASISLTSYKANELIYAVSASRDQLAVFSEIYYEDGWNAYLDGKLVPHMRANYVLRSLMIPKGEHELVFKFEPRVIETGNMISLVSYGLLILIPLGWFLRERQKKTFKPNENE